MSSGTYSTAVIKARFSVSDRESFVRALAPMVNKFGLFIQTESTRPEGTDVRFEFELKDAAEVYIGEGVVIKAFPPGSIDGKIPGILVRVRKTNRAFQEVFEAIVRLKKERKSSAAHTAVARPEETAEADVGEERPIRKPCSTSHAAQVIRESGTARDPVDFDFFGDTDADEELGSIFSSVFGMESDNEGVRKEGSEFSEAFLLTGAEKEIVAAPAAKTSQSPEMPKIPPYADSHFEVPAETLIGMPIIKESAPSLKEKPYASRPTPAPYADSGMETSEFEEKFDTDDLRDDIPEQILPSQDFRSTIDVHSIQSSSGSLNGHGHISEHLYSDHASYHLSDSGGMGETFGIDDMDEAESDFLNSLPSATDLSTAPGMLLSERSSQALKAVARKSLERDHQGGLLTSSDNTGALTRDELKSQLRKMEQALYRAGDADDYTHRVAQDTYQNKISDPIAQALNILESDDDFGDEYSKAEMKKTRSDATGEASVIGEAPMIKHMPSGGKAPLVDTVPVIQSVPSAVRTRELNDAANVVKQGKNDETQDDDLDTLLKKSESPKTSVERALDQIDMSSAVLPPPRSVENTLGEMPSPGTGKKGLFDKLFKK